MGFGKLVRALTVVQILPSLQSGGVERGTLEVANELVNRGHRSIVISAGGRLVPQLVAHGSEHIEWQIGAKSPFSLRYIRPLRRFLREQKVDILHLRSRFPAWIAWLAWRGMPPEQRPHFVTTVHGLHSVSRYSAIQCRGERVIAVSNTVRDYILQHYPETPTERIRVIHRGVDPQQFPRGFQPNADWLAAWRALYPQLIGKHVLTLAGRITRLKGHSDFIELIAKLRQQGIDVHGLIVGDEDPKRRAYAAEVRQTVAKLGLEPHLTFTGHRADIREVYAISDLVLSLSSKPESFGRSVLEALSLGRPVLGYAHGGVAEILSRLYPLGAVPLGDTQELTQRAAQLLANPVPVEPFTDFSLQQMLDETLALYEELVQSPAMQPNPKV